MYLSKGQKGTLTADNRTVLVCLAVFVFACVHVCVRVTPLVTDARLFMCEVWECCLVGRWVDTHVLASACVKRSVCG